MNPIKVFLCLTIVFIESQTTFVTIGDYPDYRFFDINLPECGLKFGPTIETFNITFNRKCFRNDYPPKSVDIYYYNLDKSSEPGSRIFGGESVEEGESPWTVLLTMKSDDGQHEMRCTGSLLTFQWVITAAHCQPGDGRNLTIWAGARERYRGAERTMTRFIANPYFLRPEDKQPPVHPVRYPYLKMAHDVGLIKLDRPYEPMKKSSHYLWNTICLPGRNETQPDNTRDWAKLFGFGLIEGGAGVPFNFHKYLQKGDIYLKSWEHCHPTICTLYEAEFGRIRICSGDSGGPLVQEVHNRAVQIGITSAAEPDSNQCNEHATEEAYWANVPWLVDWILTTVRDNS